MPRWVGLRTGLTRAWHLKRPLNNRIEIQKNILRREGKEIGRKIVNRALFPKFRAQLDKSYNQKHLQLMIGAQKYVCLNPKCLSPSERVFEIEKVNSHRKCGSWILSSNGPLTPLPQLTLPLGHEITINFQSQGIYSINSILKLNQWPHQLNQVFEEMKLRIVDEIEGIKNQKARQFQLLYQKAEAADEQIRVIIEKLNDAESVDLANYPNLVQLQRQSSLTLYQAQKLIYYFENTVLKELRNISSFIQSSTSNYDQEEQRRRRLAVERANQYFFQNSETTVNDKIQKLTTLLKSEMVKTVFDPSLSLFKTSCWICQMSLWSPKEDPTKLGCLQNLLLHLVKSHSKEVYLNYMSRALRYEVEEVSMESFLQKIRSEKVGQVIVIDRENAGLIEKPLELDKNKLWIEAVNRDNRNLAKGSYIVADSKRKDASDILITFLIYEMAKSDVGKITLVTKDHFGTTLQEVLGGLYKDKLQCIEPQDFALKLNESPETAMKE